MLVLISSIVLLIIGIICCVMDRFYWVPDGLYVAGISLILVTTIILIIISLCLALKPLDYETFKVEYDTVKEIPTSLDDIRDTDYTKKLIEINSKINTHKKLINNKWIGIFYNKKISELEPLNKINKED